MATVAITMHLRPSPSLFLYLTNTLWFALSCSLGLKAQQQFSSWWELPYCHRLLLSHRKPLLRLQLNTPKRYPLWDYRCFFSFHSFRFLLLLFWGFFFCTCSWKEVVKRQGCKGEMQKEGREVCPSWRALNHGWSEAQSLSEANATVVTLENPAPARALSSA